MPISLEDLANQAAEFCAIASASPDEAKHDLWEYSVGRANELRPHFEYDAKPTEQLKRARPKEDSAVADYRIDSYQPITYSFIRRVLTYLQRIFNPSLFHLSFSDIDVEVAGIDASNSLRSYLTKQLPTYGSLVGFLRDFGLEKMAADPNGYVVIFTDKSDSQLFEEEGPQALQRPYPQIVGSQHAFQCGDNSLVVKSTQVSEVKVSNDSPETVDEGEVYFVFTPDVTFRVVQVGVKSDKQFAAEIWNFHEAGEAAFVQFGGKPIHFDGEVLTPNPRVAYDSHLQPAIPFLNKLISLDSEQSASYLMHIFIQRWEEAIDCPVCEGTGRTSYYDPVTKQDIHKKCDHCDGKGVMNAGTTFKRMFIDRGEDGKLDPTPPMGFVAPPVDIVETVENKLKSLRKEALEALNMGFLQKREASNVESAEAKRQEKDGLNTMLEAVRSDIDRIANFVGRMVNHIRYPALGGRLEENNPIIAAPANFDLETPMDSASFIKELKEACAPSYYIREVLKQNATQRFGAGSKQAEKIHVALDLDPFLALSAEDIADLNQAGASIRDLDLTIHAYMPELIRKAIEQNDSFLELSREDQRELVEALAAEYQPEEAPTNEGSLGDLGLV